MQLRFHGAENQQRRVCSEGLCELSQQEIAVTVSWPEHDPRETQLVRLYDFFEDYLRRQPQRLLAGQTIRYGWTTLRFVRDLKNLNGIDSNVLLLEELQYPFSQEKSSYVPGVNCALSLLQLQEETLHRNRISGDAIHPHRSQRALVCTRVTPKMLPHRHPLMVHRAYQPDAQDSGWFVGCADQDHDHDNPAELEAVHLHHLVNAFPGLFPYLAMPVDTMLVYEKSQVILFHPREQEGQLDPGDLLEVLPCSGFLSNEE